MDWPDGVCLKLIWLYEKQSCLYDYVASEYHKRVSKLQAWEQLVRECGVSVCIRNLSSTV